MSIIAAQGATRAVELFVLSLNTHLASTPQVEPERAGTKRRVARQKAEAKAMKKWWASAAKATKSAKDSRQVLRRMARDAAKSKRSATKRSAMRANAIGGAAAVA